MNNLIKHTFFFAVDEEQPKPAIINEHEGSNHETEDW